MDRLSLGTGALSVGVDLVDPIGRGGLERAIRGGCSLIPGLAQAELAERMGEIHYTRKLEQHYKLKDEFERDMKVSKKEAEIMALATTNDIEPLAASILLKEQRGKKNK